MENIISCAVVKREINPFWWANTCSKLTVRQNNVYNSYTRVFIVGFEQVFVQKNFRRRFVQSFLIFRVNSFEFYDIQRERKGFSCRYPFVFLIFVFIWKKVNFERAEKLCAGITFQFCVFSYMNATKPRKDLFFYHNKIHPPTNYKVITNKSNKTRQHRTQNLDKRYTA